MKVLNFQECVGSTSSTQSASKLAFYSSILLFTFSFESFRCSALYSSLHLSILRCVLVNFCSFLPSSLPFFFWVNNFFHFLNLMLPSLLYHLRKKIQTLWRDTNGRSESGKRKMQRVIERHARRRRFNNFFFKIFLLL